MSPVKKSTSLTSFKQKPRAKRRKRWRGETTLTNRANHGNSDSDIPLFTGNVEHFFVVALGMYPQKRFSVQNFPLPRNERRLLFAISQLPPTKVGSMRELTPRNNILKRRTYVVAISTAFCSDTVNLPRSVFDLLTVAVG